MTHETPANADHLRVALKVVATMPRSDGSEAFDRERHPHLMHPTRGYNCLCDHIIQATLKNMTGLYNA